MDREKTELFKAIFTLMSLRASPEEGMRAVIELAKILGVKRICIFLKDADEQMLLMCGHPADKHGVGQKIKLEEHSGLKKIMNEKKMFIIKNPGQDKRSACTPDFCKTHSIQTSLFVRLEIEKNPIGVVIIDAVGEKKTFTKHDIQTAKQIALLATKEIHNKRRVEKSAKDAMLALIAKEVAHEFRNPLVVVTSFAKKLQQKMPKDSSFYKYTKIIAEESERLELLLKQLLASIKTGNVNLTKQSLKQIVESVLSEIKQKIEKRGESIEIEIDKKERIPPIYADPTQLGLAIKQLLKNAADAIGESVGEKIVVKISRKPHFVCLTITNTGSYIQKDELQTIFMPFYSTKKKNNKGIGLGLTIARQIIENHGGQIEAQSQQNPPMTSFQMLLPIKPTKKSK